MTWMRLRFSIGMNLSNTDLISTIFIVILFLMLHGEALSQWTYDPAQNTPICSHSGTQALSSAFGSSPRYWHQSAPYASAPDIDGGAITVWRDDRIGAGFSNWDIYAQKIDSCGVACWDIDGIPVCTYEEQQWHPIVVSDGEGGAIIAWVDRRSGPSPDIYAQRVNASGSLEWDIYGVPICTDPYADSYPTIVSDGEGGAIICWYNEGPLYRKIYAQRVRSSGSVAWTTNGILISNATGNQQSPIIASDGGSGAIITWEDLRGTTFDIYVQHIDSMGVTQWTPSDGVGICREPSDDQRYPTIISDFFGGAIIAWQDYRWGEWDIYAQRVDASGSIQWVPDGERVCVANGDQTCPGLAADGYGGAIISWQDNRTGIDQVYAQWISDIGNCQWVLDGLALFNAALRQLHHTISSDGKGEAIITCETCIIPGSSGTDLYAQSVNIYTGIKWHTDGIAVSTNLNNQYFPTIVSDGCAGAIIIWNDNRSPAWDIYAQRVNTNGILYGVGDVNSDGTTNILDVLAIVNYVLGLQLLDEIALMRADCTCDGLVNIVDALGIVNSILGISSCPP